MTYPNTRLDRLPEPEVDEGIWEVYAMRFASNANRTAHENFVNPPLDIHDGPMPMDFFMWIARSRTRTVLIDTGFGRQASAARNRPFLFEPSEALERIGIDVRSIDHVILTHLHYDHAGCLQAFPTAQVHVQDAEVSYATGRCMCHAPTRFPYDVEDVVHLVRRVFGEQVAFHAGDVNLFPGLSLHLLPGHSAGLQGVRLMTARGHVLLASDASHYYANFQSGNPFPVTVDAALTARTFGRLRELVESDQHIVPGHDPLVRAYYPTISVAGIELQVLHMLPVQAVA